jgi:hypothetical protein
MTTTTALKVLGITDEKTECECCGRTDLKRTVVVGTGEGDVRYLGTECASKVLGWDATRVNREFTSAKRAAAERAAYDAWKIATFGDTSDSLDRIRQYRAAMGK